MDGPIASAVVLPDQDVESPPPTALSPSGQKRRQSSVSEQSVKRPRLNGDNSPSDRRDSISSHAQEPAPVPKRRERGRERRLFGAALGALSQNSATAAQKRRSEIEKRQQAQRKIEEEESEQRKLERQAKRKAQRWKEQKFFDRSAMRIRHDNLLAMAHFLQTSSEPRLYYKPWELTPEQDDRIRDQIAEAHEVIRRELEENEARQPEDAERERKPPREGLTEGTADVSQTGKKADAETPLEPAVANDGSTDGSDPSTTNPELKGDPADGLGNKAVSELPAVVDVQSSAVTNHETPTDETHKEVVDENGEEVVEAAEDTVIY